MTRHRTLSRRLARMEAILAGIVAEQAPSVVTVRVGTVSRDDAVTAHRSRYLVRTGLLVVPAKPANDAEHALFAARFKVQQLEIVRAVRRSYSHAADETLVSNAILSAPRSSKLQSKTKPWVPRSRQT